MRELFAQALIVFKSLLEGIDVERMGMLNVLFKSHK